jgi:photosystem II stability/assembly factor-like uncharacterized protein
MRYWGLGMLGAVLLVGSASPDGAPAARIHQQGETSDPSPVVPPAASMAATTSGASGIHVGELHFLDEKSGWAPASRSCGTRTCVVVYATDNGGATWRLRTDPPLPVGDATDSQVLAAPMVRLATRDSGWLVDVDGNLYSTRDGARTWRAEPQANRTVALEAFGRNVWRLDRVCPPSNARCRYTLFVTDDAGDHWSPAEPQPPIGDAGVSSLTPSLVRPSAQAAYILSDVGDYPEANHSGDPPPREWKPNPILAKTLDGGRTWATIKPPCPAIGQGGYWGADLATSSPDDLWLVCHDAAGSGAMQPKHLRRSSDGGRHWSEDLGTPNPGNGGRTAAGSPLRACRGGSRTSIACTRDGGRTWFYPVPNGEDNPRDGGVEVYQFADDRRGWAIGQDIHSGNFNVLWRTDDGGETWSPTQVAS